MKTVREKERQGTLDMQAMTEAYAKLAVPGEQHKLLARMAGSWITKNTSWMGPDQPPQESTGTSENKLIYDGRFLYMEYTDTMNGKPVGGTVIMGFDNHTKKYVTASLGSMGTGIFLFEGPDSPDGKTITQENRYDEPVRGPMTYRAVTRLVDDNTFTFEMSGIDRNGNAMKMMETTYTRRK